MIFSLFFSVLAFSAGKSLPPETLLAKIIVPVPELSPPGRRQYLNPFSEVGASYTNLTLGKDEHEFSLILTPKGLSEANGYKHLSQALSTEFELSRKILQSQSLLQRSQKLSALEARRSRTEIKNVLKSNADLIKSIQEMIDREAESAGVENFLSSNGMKLEELNTSELMGPEEIETRLEKLSSRKSTALTSKKIISENGVNRFHALHSSAQRSKFFNDIKIGMRQEKKEQSFRLEVSFHLPFLAAQDLDDFRDSLRLAEGEVKSQQALLEESQRTAGLERKLRQKISLYKSMGATPPWQKSALLQQDPSLALELQRTGVALRLTKASLLAEIRLLYINYLFETEVLAEQPEFNHLSRDLRKI